MDDGSNNLDRYDVGGHAELARLAELYEATVLRVVTWSEAEVLSPQYLHLHEQDIGIEHGYELGDYLVAFIDSLADLRSRLRRIVFCYSYEATEPTSLTCNADSCSRERFYGYEVLLPRDGPVGKSDIVWTRGDVATKPLEFSEHSSIETLGQFLEGCDLVQPYMLRHGEGGIDAQYEQVEFSAATVSTLISWFQAPGGYQFSLYGFEVADGRLTFAEQLMLNMAFLIHIWTWNHDLRTTHQVRQVALHNLPQSRELWARLSVEFESLFDRLRNLHISGDGHAECLIALREEHVSELFESPHDFSEWTLESMPGFLEVAHRRIANRRLTQFLEFCGWSGTEVDRPSADSATTKARGCWLATKYLTRCALDHTGENYRKISFDQMVLATLLGLHDSRVTDIRLVVERSLNGPKVATSTERQLLAELGLAFEDPEFDWPTTDYDLRYATDADGGRSLVTSWKFDGKGGQYLPGFLGSGMMAMQMIGPALHVFDAPLKIGEADGLPVSAFLLVVARVARALARQAVEPDPLVTLREVRALLRTRYAGDARKYHRARIEFQLKGKLPANVAPGSGQLSGPLTRLASWCGATTPTRVDGPVDSDDWNCFVVNHDGEATVVLTFSEGVDR